VCPYGLSLAVYARFHYFHAGLTKGASEGGSKQGLMNIIIVLCGDEFQAACLEKEVPSCRVGPIRIAGCVYEEMYLLLLLSFQVTLLVGLYHHSLYYPTSSTQVIRLLEHLIVCLYVLSFSS
jgi:hypothetical protein